MMKGVYCVTGTNTHIGKTVATGWLAQRLSQEGNRVITQKLVQVGCKDVSQDILAHRQLMGIPLQEVDKQGLTMPAVFPYRASPHLAAELDGFGLDLDNITQATRELERQYDVVLLEGTGGLMTPLTRQVLTVDYLREQNYPVILVTSGRLGTLTHTLSCLYCIKQYGLTLKGVVYNHMGQSIDAVVAHDSREYLKNMMEQNFPEAEFWDLPLLNHY